MSLVRNILTIVKQGSTILTRATRAAGKQAYLNVTYNPEKAEAAFAPGTSSNNAGNMSQALSQKMNMSYEEASSILHLSPEAQNLASPEMTRSALVAEIEKRYSVLFAANEASGTGKDAVYSHYLQSKVVRAKERLLAELEQEREQVMH